MSLVTSTLERTLARIDDGHRRILVWGPPGAGLRTVLDAVAARRPCTTLEARTRDDAERALRAGAAQSPVVVAWVDRCDLDADAYVECALPSVEQCVRWLDAELVREGVELADERADDRASTLRALVLAAERTPDALAKIAPLLRVLSPRSLRERCAASVASARRGERATHPLLSQRWPDPPPLSTLERAALAVIVAAPTSLTIDEIEARADAELDPERACLSPSTAVIDALAALRDRALIRQEEQRWSAPFAVVRRMIEEPAFAQLLRECTDRESRRCARGADAFIERWRTTGDPAAIAALEQQRPALEAAASELSGRADDPAVREAFVRCTLALALAKEPREGLASVVALLSDAITKLDRLSAERATLAVELARAHRLRTEWGKAAALLDEIDLTAVAPSVVAAVCFERALQLRFEAVTEARQLMRRAHELYGSIGYEYEQAQCVIGLGSLEFWQQRLTDALPHYERARELSAKLGARKAEAIALTNMCLCHAMLGDDVAATAAGSQAVRHFRALGERGAEGTTLGHLAMIALQRGRLDQAEARFVEAEALLERAGYLEQQRYVRFNRAEVSFARGRVDRASTELDRVEELLAVSPDPYTAVHVAALRADMLEASERYAEALAALDRGLREGASLEATVAALIAPRRVRLLARARRAGASVAAAREAERGLALVRSTELQMAARIALGHAAWLRGEREGDALAPEVATLTRAIAPAWVGLAARRALGESVVESLPVRHASALYWADLGPAERTTIEWNARDPALVCVCVDEALGVARLPGGATITRAARRNAFLLLAQLAAATEYKTRHELIEALWPGERMQPSAASNRLSNAVAQLRALGGSSLVHRDDDRYSLRAGLGAVRSGGAWFTLEHAE